MPLEIAREKILHLRRRDELISCILLPPMRERCMRCARIFTLRKRHVRIELMRSHFPIHLLFVFLAATMPFAASGCTGGSNEKKITVTDFHSAREKNPHAVVLDVRTPEELGGELGALRGVINIPVQELESRLRELDGKKSGTVYVICRSGNRSRTATDLLNEKGFSALNVEGGMKAWRSAFGSVN